jgi:hypothetical protein
MVQVDQNGERRGIVNRPFGVSTERLVFDAKAALGPPPLPLIAAGRIDCIVSGGIRPTARLDLRCRPGRSRGRRIGVWIIRLVAWKLG